MSLDFKIVKNYSHALLANALSISKETQLLEQVNIFVSLMKQHAIIDNVLCSPVIDRLIKVKLVDFISNHYKFEVIFKSFLHVLIKNSRCNLLPQISGTLDELIEDAKGVKSAEVFSAFKLGKKELQAIKKMLEEKTGQKIKLEDRVEESLIGGMVLKYNSNLIDCSVQGALDRIERVALRSKI